MGMVRCRYGEVSGLCGVEMVRCRDCVVTGR